MKKVTKLIDDGHAYLWVDYEPKNLGKDVIAIGVSDGGGFSSVYVPISEIETLKSKLDAFLKGVKNENTKTN